MWYLEFWDESEERWEYFAMFYGKEDCRRAWRTLRGNGYVVRVVHNGSVIYAM